MRIFKYRFTVSDDRQIVRMPKGALIIKVAYQGATPTLWAIVDPLAKEEDTVIYVMETGQDLSPFPLGKYLGTAFSPTGGVWHVFGSE